MEKKDLMYLVAALVLVLIIALVIKPIATGQPIKTGISTPTTEISQSPATLAGSYAADTIPVIITSAVPTSPPTTNPTWNPNAPKEVSFVGNASKYGVSFDQSILHGTQFNETATDNNRTIIASISRTRSSNATQLSGATEIMYIPFPYWELVYTITPSTSVNPVTIEITPSRGQGLAYSGVSGSYSSSSPQFTIQVMDGDDPNRIVRTISPPGGIDVDLWEGIAPTTKENSNYYARQKKTVVPTPTAVDPRPWTEKFYEGQRNYYFIITAQSLESYEIEIKVPSRYIGKY